MMMTGIAVLTATFLAATPADPGPRAGRPGAGGPLRDLTPGQLAAFREAQAKFNEADGVDEGLGPMFNLDSCGGCHAQPAIGGSAPAINPQISVASKNGARNRIPGFLEQNGPVRVARLKRNADGSRNGGVQALFTIEGRSDAPNGCRAPQFDFAPHEASNNLTFRIPTPVFGGGMMEVIPDQAILDNMARNGEEKRRLGIGGRPHRSPNDGTIMRFGWKAQNKSLLMFSGEAYNVEQGVSNDLFPNERHTFPGCSPLSPAEDTANLDSAHALESMGDVALFAIFMRFSDQPVPAPDTPSIRSGRDLFNSVGCALCHTPVWNTGPSSIPALNRKRVLLFSDMLLHRMGSRLVDDTVQGEAGPDEWRTAPLWGLGQRLFFLHDGRTSDLMQAILEHRSPQNGRTPPSEANAVVDAFTALKPEEQQDVLNFLRSL